MARIRIYLGKKHYTGYYDDVPLEMCTKKIHRIDMIATQYSRTGVYGRIERRNGSDSRT